MALTSIMGLQKGQTAPLPNSFGPETLLRSAPKLELSGVQKTHSALVLAAPKCRL